MRHYEMMVILDPDLEERAVSPLIESFLDMMSAERGASPNTLTAYRRDLLDFTADVAKAGSDLKRATREQRNHR